MYIFIVVLDPSWARVPPQVDGYSDVEYDQGGRYSGRCPQEEDFGSCPGHELQQRRLCQKVWHLCGRQDGSIPRLVLNPDSFVIGFWHHDASIVKRFFKMNFLYFLGRVLPAPKLVYGRGESSPMVPKDGTWNMRNFHFVDARQMQDFGVLNITHITDQAINTFIGALVRAGRNMGIYLFSFVF